MKATKEMTKALLKDIIDLINSPKKYKELLFYTVIVQKDGNFRLAINNDIDYLLNNDDTRSLITSVRYAKESRKLTEYSKQFPIDFLNILDIRGFINPSDIEIECEKLQKELLILEKNLDYLDRFRPMSIGLLLEDKDKKEEVSIGMVNQCFYDGGEDIYYPLHYKDIYKGEFDLKTNIVNLADKRENKNKYAYMINDLLTFKTKEVRGLVAGLKAKSLRYDQSNIDLAKELTTTCKYLIKITESINNEMKLVRKSEKEYATYKNLKR